jgi:hypothetical protein
VHSTTHYSPFQIVYVFNPLTPLDLKCLPINELTSLDRKKKADLVKDIHAKAKENIKAQTEKYAAQHNKKKRPIAFNVGDWVWVHFRKERFPNRRKSKLDPQGDGPFQVLEKINNNAYKINLPGEYNVHTTLNVSDISPFDVGQEDLRTNPFEERVNDGDREGTAKDIQNVQDDGIPIIPQGPIIRSRTNKLRHSM